MGGPFEGKYRNASVLHDVAYDQHIRPWEECDRMFYNAMRCSGVSAVEAKTMYFALYKFGRHWNRPRAFSGAVARSGETVPRALPVDQDELNQTKSWIESADPSLAQIEQRADQLAAIARVKKRDAAIIFVLVTVTLDMLAVGLIAPVLPKLILDFLGSDMKSAADWNGVFGTVFALMQFFFSPVLGVLSDRFGRRPVILLSNLGLGLDYMVMAMAPTLSWLFVGRIIAGITSIEHPNRDGLHRRRYAEGKRAGAFGYIGVAFGIGFVLGPMVGGLLGEIGTRLPFWVAAGFSLANWLWSYFFVPESLPADRRKEFTFGRANPVGSLALLRSHHELWRLATIQFLAYIAHNVFSIWALYAIYRYAGRRERSDSLSALLVFALR